MPDERPDQLRLFVACELPDDVRLALGRVQEDLRRMGAGRLRWVRPEGIHVTLKFLGGVEAGRVDAVKSALASAVEPFELRLRLAAAGTFGGERVRVVWVGLEGDTEELAALAGRVDKALAPLGFPRERRRFSAHLTIARTPDALGIEERRQLASLIRSYEAPASPEFVVRTVSLMRSHLGRGGSVYERLEAFPSRE